MKKRWLENGFNYNPNGAGFAWTDGERVVIEKGFFGFASFWKAYKGHQEQACVIHFRMATHGAVDEQNCHPWPLCDGKYAVIHNGILNIQSTEQVSDTGHFVNLVMEPAVRAMGVGAPALHYLIEQAVGAQNKIVVLKPDGSAVIFNEKSGFWVDGVWFSNTSYQDPVAPSKGWLGFERELWSGYPTRKTRPVGLNRFGLDSETRDLAEFYVGQGMDEESAVEAAVLDMEVQAEG